MPKVVAPLKAAEVASRTEVGKYAIGNPAGLTLVVLPAPGGGIIRKFVLRVRADGASTDRTIGPFDPHGGGKGMTLAAAREKAHALRQEIAAGNDPLARKREKRAEAQAERKKATTFREVAEAYIGTARANWRNDRTEQQWRLMLQQYVYPTIGDLPVGEVAVDHVEEILRPIWGTKLETARRVRRRIEAVLEAAAVRGLRTGANPALVKTVNRLLGKQSSAVRRHPAISVEDAPRLWAAIAATEGVSARALQLLLLTCTRSQEARHAVWSEFDLERAIWTIPSDRTKTGEPFRVPLSTTALSLLRALRPGAADQLLFTTQTRGRGPNRRAVPLTDMAPAMVLRRLDAADRAAGGPGFRDARQAAAVVTPHGCARSTSRDWMAGAGVDFGVAEACLAHLPPPVVRAYLRGDLLDGRRDVLERWALYLEGRE